MLELPLVHQNFVSAVTFEAEYTTDQGSEIIWIEIRTYLRKINEAQFQTLFTHIGSKEVRVSSIQDLVSLNKNCLSLSIPHTVMVNWDDVSKRAVLTEVYVPDHKFVGNRQCSDSSWSVQLLLFVEGQFFKTDLAETLQEAFSEMNEQLRPQGFRGVKICYECDYGFPKLLGLQDERENIQCFRDVSENLQEVKTLRKVASFEAMNSGDFFVSSFHTCAAWKPWPALQ